MSKPTEKSKPGKPGKSEKSEKPEKPSKPEKSEPSGEPRAPRAPPVTGGGGFVKQVCKYGKNCNRKDANHMNQFTHG